MTQVPLKISRFQLYQFQCMSQCYLLLKLLPEPVHQASNPFALFALQANQTILSSPTHIVLRWRQIGNGWWSNRYSWTRVVCKPIFLALLLGFWTFVHHTAPWHSFASLLMNKLQTGSEIKFDQDEFMAAGNCYRRSPGHRCWLLRIIDIHYQSVATEDNSTKQDIKQIWKRKSKSSA